MPYETYAGKFMGDMIRKLAEAKPELRDISGRAFWPVSLYFPVFLTNTLNLLQGEIVRLHNEDNRENAELLTYVRMGVMKITYEGDLGEDHTSLFVNDHPDVYSIPQSQVRGLPFYQFCQGAIAERNPIVLLGMMTRNEEGSIGELEALLETDLIRKGSFSDAHAVEEIEHARVSEGIKEKMLKHPNYRDSFTRGLELHDELYTTILS